MQVVSIISTKGGVGKTTTAANLGGFAADAGLRVLLLDLDVQPTLSSYFTLDVCAPGGIYEMLAFNERRIEQLVSRTAIAGLEEKLVDEHTQVHCGGSFRLGRRTYRCWKKEGHGTVDLNRAIVQSCDVYFYKLGLELGVNRLAYYARSRGLGARTGIELEHKEKIEV